MSLKIVLKNRKVSYLYIQNLTLLVLLIDNTWIGITGSTVRELDSWENVDAVTWTNFNVSTSELLDLKCAAMSHQGGWQLMNCTENKTYICEGSSFYFHYRGSGFINLGLLGVILTRSRPMNLNALTSIPH